MRKVLSATVVAINICMMSTLSYAASDKCTVVRVENDTLVLKCSKKNGTFRVNDKIKIKSMRKKAVEGC